MLHDCYRLSSDETRRPMTRLRGAGSLLASAGLLALTIGCAASKANPSDPAAPASEAPRGGDGVELQEASRKWVTVEAASSRAFGATIEAPGRVELRDTALQDVAAHVPGRVARLHVLVGDRVEAGQVLVTLESSEAIAARTELAATRAELAAASDALRRQTRLMESGVGIELERVNAQTRLAQARSAVERAERAAAMMGEGEGSTIVLKAPGAGTVLERNVTQGTYVGPESGALLRIGDPDQVWLVAQVFERDLGEVRVGAKATMATVNGASLSGTVARIGSLVDVATRRVPVYVELDSQGGIPRAGTWTRVKLSGVDRRGLVLPTEAVLVKDQGKSVVYVEREGRFHATPVELGGRSNGSVEILSGLSEGETVVVRGALLIDGQASLLL